MLGASIGRGSKVEGGSFERYRRQKATNFVFVTNTEVIISSALCSQRPSEYRSSVITSELDR